MPSLTYQLPKDRRLVARVVCAIPSEWPSLEGYLFAAARLYKERIIAGNTRLIVGRDEIRFKGRTDYPYGQEEEEQVNGKTPSNFAEVVFDHKFPSSVHFDEAGFNLNEVSMETAKKIAAKFIRKGYFGWLNAYSGSTLTEKFANPEVFELNHAQGTIKLIWHSQYKGKRDKLNGLVKLINTFRLKQLK